MEIAFSEKISPQLSAALLSTPYELGKEGGLSSGYLPESDSWEVIVKYVGDIEKIKEKYPSVLITRLLGNYAVLVIEKSLVIPLPCAMKSYIWKSQSSLTTMCTRARRPHASLPYTPIHII